MRDPGFLRTVRALVKAILQFLEREALWPLVVLVLGALIILPGLGDNGFWEPVEIGIADTAKKRLEKEDDAAEEDESRSRSRADQQKNQSQKKKTKTLEDVKPPLTLWSVGHGMEMLDSASWGSRLPLALLGLGAVLIAFFLGRRMASPRAGLLSGLILLTSPLLLFQSRQLMSDIGAVTGSALTVLGLVGLAWPAGRRPVRVSRRADREAPPPSARPAHRLWLYPVDLAMVVAGAVLSYYSSAALLGVVVPFAAVGLASLGAMIGKLHVERDQRCAVETGRPGGRQVWLAIGLGLLVVSAIAAVILESALGGRHAFTSYMFMPALLATVCVVVGLMPQGHRYRLSDDARWRRWHLLSVGLLALAVALTALFMVLAQVFDIKHPIPGERALFGHSLMANHEPLSILGGEWRERLVANATFDVHFEQIAFGLFPWVVLAPVAIAHIATGLRPGRFTWSGHVLFAWAAFAWLVCGILERKVGPVLYPALVPIAVAVGMWLDDLLEARDQADATTESDRDARAYFGMSLRPPLVALFAFAAAIVLAMNIALFPDRFLSLNVLGKSISFPKGELSAVLKVKLTTWLALLGVLFALALSLGLFLWASHKRVCHAPRWVFALRRYGIHAAFGISLVFALFLTQVWTPTLSEQLSSKNIFGTYNALRSEGDELVLLGQYGSAPDLYIEGPYERVRGQSELVSKFRDKNRIFALVPSANQCTMNRSLSQTGGYYVLERNAKSMLISNKLRPEAGEEDINPLVDVILDEPPADVGTPLDVNYDNRIELIGVDMPESVARGDSFTMTMFYKVRKPVGGSWKVFVHFDGGGARFQGDHDPIEGMCATNFWQAGDYIVDRFEVRAGDITFQRTNYSVHVGFFQGSHGNWKNMNVVSAKGPSGELSVGADKRVNIGTIRVR